MRKVVQPVNVKRGTVADGGVDGALFDELSTRALCDDPCRLGRGTWVWGHIQVTKWALSELEDEEMQAFFNSPEVRNAALFGSAFTDSGYWPASSDISATARAYGEHTHWEPFVQDFVTWILANDPPP